MESIIFKCEFCGKEFEKKDSYNGHKGNCKKNPNWKPRSISNNTRKKISEKMRGRHLSDECKRQKSLSLKGKSGHLQSEETKKKISETCKKNKLSGGYRKGSGRGKKGTYKGYYCDSSWELAYVIYNLDHNIKFERNEELFPYEFNGEQHKYKPDFIEGDTYVEIKGYFTEQVKAKEKAFPFKLKYINGETILPYLKYVEQKYGKDFIRLYEDKKYESKIIKPKVCEFCGKELNIRASLKKHQDACFRKKQESLNKREGPWNKMTEEKLLERKEIILNSGVDMMKFGWVGKMEKATGLSKHQIEDCVRYFNLSFFKRVSAK